MVAVFYSNNKSSKRRVNLLRLVSVCKTHYCLIKNFSNLLQRLTRSEKKRKHGSKSKFCSNCFQPIIKRNYRRHKNFCESNAPLEYRMPVSSPHVEFQNWQKTGFRLCTRISKPTMSALEMPVDLVPTQKKLKDSIHAVSAPSSWRKDVSFHPFLKYKVFHVLNKIPAASR